VKIVTIIGARPQFIKAAPFSRIFRKQHREVLVHTGQHYDQNMSDVFFQELSIPVPDYNLNIGSGPHGQQTGRMLEKIEAVLLQEKPDGVLVYGDTNSTLAGALAAGKLRIPLYHVEAGLRSYNQSMPEEMNRVLTDHAADLLLCPTVNAVENLRKEGIEEGVLNTGDIMYDAVLRNKSVSKDKYSHGKWLAYLAEDNCRSIELEEGGYYLATVHRAENTDNRYKLETILQSLELLDKPVLLPIHPRTRKLVSQFENKFTNILLVNPVGYLLMLYLTSHAHMIVTDSGGLQKEAYFLGVPCTTLRDETEWVETLDKGWNVLSAIDMESITAGVGRKFDRQQTYQPKPFGEGHAAESICRAIIEEYEVRV
jgi:UDP-GlcNAc3NAcA epimerase